MPLLHGQKAEAWRTVALVEHRGPLRQLTDPDMPGLRGGNPPSYEAIRMPRALYVEYETGEKYHDLATDPDELRNSFATLTAAEKASLQTTLAAVKTCHDSANCWPAEYVARSAARN
jgi:N-acetylglucosamine-6-sulfatase